MIWNEAGGVSRRKTKPGRRRRSGLCAWAGGWLLCAAHAAAADGSAATPAARAVDTRSLAATCAACHGTDGKAVRGAAMPGLAGLPSAYFVMQMEAFRSGARSGTVMPQIARGFSAGQTDALAAYFAAQ